MKRGINSHSRLNRSVMISKLWPCCLVVLWVAVLLPWPGFAAKPKLVLGKCVVSSKCASDSIQAGCADLYCRALKAGCKGNYSSGTCKDIKDLHDAASCSLFAKSDCGNSLPRIFAIGGLLVVIDGELFVSVDSEDDSFDIISALEAAAVAAALVPELCLERCQRTLGQRSCADACEEICAPLK